MGQQNAVGRHATTVSHDGQYTVVTYHSTQVIKWDAERIVLNSGGWQTSTTKTRINQASNQYGLGIHVYQRNYEWWVQCDWLDEPISFFDGIGLLRQRTLARIGD